MTGFADVADAYLEAGFQPFPVRGKGRQDNGLGGLPKGATGREGTVTPEKIAEWKASAFWSAENTALRSDGSWISIDVDAYDGKVGHETLARLEAELGELPATITSTAREPYLPNGAENESRQRFYLVPMGLEFLTKLHDVEIIQRHHRYSVVWPSVHPSTGNTYTWYGYDGEPLDEIPSVGDMEFLPEAWVTYLTAPTPEMRAEGEGFSGSIAEWLDRCPPGEPSALMKEWVASIPATDFGHDVMIALQGSLINLATTRGERGIPWALERLRREWLRGPYDTEQFRTDFDVSLEGAIAKFGAMPPNAYDIPGVDIAPLVDVVQHPDFLDRITKLPTTDSLDAYRERVGWVISTALDAGLSLLEAAALGWNSASAKAEGSLQASGLERAWEYALQVQANPIIHERDFSAPLAEPLAPTNPNGGIKLTTIREDVELAKPESRWWGDEFMDVQHSLNPVMSEQYYRLNRWILLSLVFADKAYFPATNGGKLILNFYGMCIGPSNTGKTESKSAMIRVPEAFYGTDSPDVGGDATPVGLSKALIERDGKTSIFHADEADALLRSWSDGKGPFAGMKNRVMEFFTGKVPAMQRSMDKDHSGVVAEARLNVHLLGVFEKIVDAIEPDDWISGFANRFVCAFGETKELTDKQMMFPIRRPGVRGATGQRDWNDQWVAQFTQIANTTLASPTGDPVWLDIDDDVLARHVETVKLFAAIAKANSAEAQLVPTFGRLEKTILKCAGLVAITRKRRRVEMNDYLIALRQAEEWATNAMTLIAATQEGRRVREMRKLEQLVERNGGRMALHAIKRVPEYAGATQYVDGLLRELIDQRRIERLDPPGIGQVSIPIIQILKGV